MFFSKEIFSGTKSDHEYIGEFLWCGPTLGCILLVISLVRSLCGDGVSFRPPSKLQFTPFLFEVKVTLSLALIIVLIRLVILAENDELSAQLNALSPFAFCCFRYDIKSRRKTNEIKLVTFILDKT